MKATTKTLLSVLIFAAVLMGVLAVADSNEFSPEGDPFKYTVLDEDAETVAVTGCEAGRTDIVIPASVEYDSKSYTVTEIGAKAFRGYNEMNSLTIPCSVQKIGPAAFQNCTGLTTLSFESGSQLKEIGKDAFAYTGKDDSTVPATIADLTLPASLETLGEGAFHCVPVVRFALEDNSKLTEIPDGFLAADGEDGKPGVNTECKNLWDKLLRRFLPLAEPYPYTPAPVARACDCLVSIDFGEGNSLTRIGVGAFKNQTHLTGLDFGQNPQSDGLTIDFGAFVAIGNNGAAGGDLAGLDTVVLPANLIKMDYCVFDSARIKNLKFSDGCKLSSIPDGFMEISGANGYPGSHHDSENEYDYSKDYFVESLVQIGANSLETVDFGENNSLTYIGHAAFRNQSHMTDISFGTATAAATQAGLKIDSGAFIGVGNNGYLVDNGIDTSLNEGIDTLVFPANLKTMDSAFEYANIKNIKFSDGCKLSQIPTNFMGICGYGCNGYPGQKDTNVRDSFVLDHAQLAANSLETIDFGENNSLTVINSSAFRNQSHIKEISFGTSTAPGLSIYGSAFIGVGNNGYLYQNGIDDTLNEGIETLVFPANLTILDSPFEYACIKNIVFSDNCQLQIIPASFMAIIGEGNNGHPGQNYAGEFVKDWAQLAANSLETVSFGENNSISSIYSAAFRNQNHLTKIDFGTSTASRLSIGQAAFAGAGNNAYLFENGADDSLSEGIETLTFPANMRYVNSGIFVFAGFRDLKFSEGCGITTLEDGSFQDLGVLETLTLGSDCPVTELKEGVFSKCTELTAIDLLNSEITTINDSLKENHKLEKVYFPETLKYITWPDTRYDQYCPFYDCGNVNMLRFAKSDPSEYEFTDNVFKFLNESGTVIVPAGTTAENIQLYKDKLTAAGLSFEDGKWTIQEYVAVTGVSLDKETVDLKVGESVSLDATVAPENASDKDVSWTSSDPTVATVDKNGNVSAVSAGTAVITVTTFDGKKTAACSVNVTIGVTGVSLDKETANLKVGQSITLIATVEPEEADNKDVSWTSSDPEVATVDENGNVNAVSAGTAEITVTTDDGDFTAACTVNVSKKSGGGDSDSTIYAINILKTENGRITADPRNNASSGDLVTVTVTPDKGYTLETLTVKDGNGKEISLTDKGDGVYTFTMPASAVSVKATFMEDNTVLNFFVDVHPDDYCYDAVMWAAMNNITNGTDSTHFSPNMSCTRAHIVTFLWRAAGSPEPTVDSCPFNDLDSSAYYYKAALWAVEKGITNGTSTTKFSPNAECTRAQTVCFIYRYEGSEKVTAENIFTDVHSSDYFCDAVIWATQNDVTTGTSATTFSPNDVCTRAQVVTFLYRDMAE